MSPPDRRAAGMAAPGRACCLMHRRHLQGAGGINLGCWMIENAQRAPSLTDLLILKTLQAGVQALAS